MDKQAELSRRVAQLMKTETIQNLSYINRLRLIQAVESVDSFDKLPDNVKKLIKQAESDNKN